MGDGHMWDRIISAKLAIKHIHSLLDASCCLYQEVLDVIRVQTIPDTVSHVAQEIESQGSQIALPGSDCELGAEDVECASYRGVSHWSYAVGLVGQYPLVWREAVSQHCRSKYVSCMLPQAVSL